MLSPFAPQGSRAATAKKHNRKSPTDPGQARCSSSFPCPSCSWLFQPPLLLLLLHLYFYLPLLSLNSLPSAPPLWGCVTESLGQLSHGGDSFNQLHMRTALIWWPSAISPDLRANHRALQWVSRHASHHRVLVFSYLSSPQDLYVTKCLNVLSWFFLKKNDETRLESFNLSFAEQQ